MSFEQLEKCYVFLLFLLSWGGLCDGGHDFDRLCKKRNKGATLHLLDVLVTQHAKWTAKRVRRGLFGQSIVDFFTDSWSSIQLQESAKSNPSQSATKQAKKTPRVLRSFAQARIQDKYQRQDVSCTGKFCKLVTTFVSWRHLYCCGTVATDSGSRDVSLRIFPSVGHGVSSCWGRGAHDFR